MIGRTLAGWGRLLGLGKTDPSADDERRLWGRLSCDVPTTWKPTQNRTTEGIPATVKNVSTGGACVHVPFSLSLGELFSLHLPSPKDECSDVLACVVRCDPVDGTTWAIGCTFASPLSALDLRRFDITADEPSPSDRRGWERFPCQARAAYQMVQVGETEPTFPAAIVNISGGGLALQPDRSLDVGDLLSVDLYHGEEHILTALASVVRTNREGTRLVAGCNFIRELEEETLARLLG